MPRRTDAARFLHALWGDKPPGLIQIWRLGDRRSFYAKAVPGAAYYADGNVDVYTGVALAAKDHGRYHRAKAAQAVAIAGLWLDIDVCGGPDRKAGVAPTLDAAVEIAHHIAEPTLVVGSGYGAHAWYLFDEPWRFATVDEQAQAALASAGWYALHRAAARAAGWSIDHTHDLARLLRPPGTLNGKGPDPVPVTTIADGGPRHDRGRLLEQAADGGGDAQLALDTTDPTLPVVDVGPARALAVEVLDALIENSPEFRRTWTHARKEPWSMSEYDLALCSIAAQAGLADQQLADLIALHRRTYDPADTKGQRLDYVRRTVAKARRGADRAADIDWFRQAATQARGVAA